MVGLKFFLPANLLWVTADECASSVAGIHTAYLYSLTRTGYDKKKA